MTPKEKIILNRARFQERQAKEFLTVNPNSQFHIPVASCQSRLKSWLQLCAGARLPNNAWMIEGKNTICLLFKNGLKISDYGQHVSFSAIQSKEDVDMKSALTVVSCAARHLCRQWKMDFDVTVARSGATEMLMAFDKAYKESAKTVISEELLKNQKSR